MGKTSEFVIPFKGLKVGIHKYNFKIDNKFFESFDYPELKKGIIDVDLTLNREENMLTLEFNIQGKVEVACDRCAGLFYQPIEGIRQLIVKFGEQEFEESDEVIVIPESEHQIDLSHFLYEYIILMLPYKKVHDPENIGSEACDPKVLEKLNNMSGESKTDPRWDALKKIKNNN